MDTQKEIRTHLLELLAGKSAHIELAKVLREFPVEKINVRLENAPHTSWELLEHIRIAQWDILEFSRDEKHVSPEFPDGLWVKIAGTAKDWQKSVETVLAELQAMRDLVADEKTDLLARIPHGDGQTIFREALLIADHNSYHLGQLAFLMKTLEKS